MFGKLQTDRRFLYFFTIKSRISGYTFKCGGETLSLFLENWAQPDPPPPHHHPGETSARLHGLLRPALRCDRTIMKAREASYCIVLEDVLQEADDVAEGRPQGVRLLPAVPHDVESVGFRKYEHSLLKWTIWAFKGNKKSVFHESTAYFCRWSGELHIITKDKLWIIQSLKWCVFSCTQLFTSRSME